jgi:hypothetical protein
MTTKAIVFRCKDCGAPYLGLMADVDTIQDFAGDIAGAIEDGDILEIVDISESPVILEACRHEESDDGN